MTKHWGDVRAALEADIAEGALRPGDRLPTEPELCKRFDVGRHSVRRAIASMSVDGLLRAEQGRGTFVEDPAVIEYTIGKRTRRTQNFAKRGVSASAHVMASQEMAASEDVARRLELEPGHRVLASTHLTEADGAPIAYGTVYRCAVRFAGFLERREQLGSVTKTYASYGISDYVRASTNILARRASAEEAQALRQHPDQPVLQLRAVDADLKGQPLSYSEVVWAATRVSFSLETGGELDV